MTKEYNHQQLFVLPEQEDDLLEALVRRAAQQMLQAALDREVNEFLARARYQRSASEEGFRGYRNGAAKERKISIGSGTIKVKMPRVSETPETVEPFESKLLKPYQRRSQTLNEVFPKLFIEGLATRDFEPALRCLVGTEAPLSPSTISRMNAQLKQGYEDWRRARLDQLRIVYLWADGIYLAAGIGDERACLLVVVGCDTTGQKHFLALEEGYRESKESWLCLEGFASERDERASLSDCGRRSGVLVGVTRSVAAHPGATVLVAQDEKHPGQAAHEGAR